MRGKKARGERLKAVGQKCRVRNAEWRWKRRRPEYASVSGLCWVPHWRGRELVPAHTRRHRDSGYRIFRVARRVSRPVRDGVHPTRALPTRACARNVTRRCDRPYQELHLQYLALCRHYPRNPVSGSLLVIETSVTVGCGSQLSVTVIVAVTFWNL